MADPCLTLSGSLTLTPTAYDLRTSHRNKNNGLEFDNAEQGTYTRQGNALSFTRTGGEGEFPYLLGPGDVSADGNTVTLLYETRVPARIRSVPPSSADAVMDGFARRASCQE